MLRRDVRIGLALSGRLLREHLRDDLLCDLPARQIFAAPLQPHGQLGRRSFKFLPCPAAYGKVGEHGARSSAVRDWVDVKPRCCRPDAANCEAGSLASDGPVHLSDVACTCLVMRTNCWWQLEDRLNAGPDLQPVALYLGLSRGGLSSRS
jgi:hypothetical protein